MKKAFKTLLMTLIAVIMVMALAACGPAKEEVIGEYELSDATITVKNGSSSAEMGKECFQYFRVTLGEDDSATISYKMSSMFGGEEFSVSGTFSCGFSGVRMTYTQDGVKYTDTFGYSDGVLTYNSKMVQDGATVTMKVELAKKA